MSDKRRVKPTKKSSDILNVKKTPQKISVKKPIASSPKRRKRSLVWNYFHLTEENFAVCNRCGYEVKKRPDATTCQLIYHLKSNHQIDVISKNKKCKSHEKT